jgi:hypothetical protein
MNNIDNSSGLEHTTPTQFVIVAGENGSGTAKLRANFGTG